MVRADFDRHLRMLQSDLLILGSMVEKAIAKSLEALKRRDLEMSRQVIREDDYIDQKRFQLEEQCVEIIATQAAHGQRPQDHHRYTSYSGGAGTDGGLRRRHCENQSDDGG